MNLYHSLPHLHFPASKIVDKGYAISNKTVRLTESGMSHLWVFAIRRNGVGSSLTTMRTTCLSHCHREKYILYRKCVARRETSASVSHITFVPLTAVKEKGKRVKT